MASSVASAGRSVALLCLCLGLALALLRGVSAHCPVGKCMHDGYMTTTFQPLGPAPLAGEMLLRGAKCAAACANAGYKWFSITGLGVCGCADSCSTDDYEHGEGFSGMTAACYLGPVRFNGTTACTTPAAAACPKACTVRNAACTASGKTSKCCCSAKAPFPVFFPSTDVYVQTAFKGCTA